jgi:hypothetical protein
MKSEAITRKIMNPIDTQTHLEEILDEIAEHGETIGLKSAAARGPSLHLSLRQCV